MCVSEKHIPAEREINDTEGLNKYEFYEASIDCNPFLIGGI